MRISEFSAQTGLSAHTIRYYEKIKLLPRPARDASGHRIYGDDLLAWAEFLKRLKATGIPLKEMVQYSELRAAGDHTAQDRQDILKAHQSRITERLEELQACQSLLTYKINIYENMKRKEHEPS